MSCKSGNKVFNVLQFFHNFQPVIWRPRPGDGMKSKLMHWNVNETATWLSWKSYQSIVEKNHNYKTWSLKLMGFGIDWGTLTRTKKPQWVCFFYCSVFSRQRWVVLQAYTFVWGYSYYTCTLNYLPYFLLQIITKCQSERVKLFFSSYRVKKVCYIYNWIWWIKQHCIHYFLFVLGEAIIDCHL